MKQSKFSLFIGIFTVILGILLSSPSAAQRTNLRDNLYIGFEPNHADWIYEIGEDVKVELSLRQHFCPVPNITLHCEWGVDQREAEKTFDVKVGKSGLETITLKGSKVPGFKTLQVSAELDGKTYTNLIKVAFSPDKLQPTAIVPKDFDQYWQKAIDKARQVPLLPRFTRKPEYDNEYCDTYEVRFQNAKAGCYLYGMLSVPKGVNPTDTIASKQYPAIILWPGAGVKQHLGDVNFFPEKGVITLEMGVHGIPVSLPEQIYVDLRANALHSYSAIISPNKDQYYYKNIYVGTVKTVDFLCSLPCVDANRLACYGGSQGGALSIVNAALDKRIRCASISYPALAEISGYARGRSEGWPHLFKGKTNDEKLMEVGDYYDVVNFAKRIDCTVLFFLGFNDIVCCPTSTYTTYNVIPLAEREKASPAQAQTKFLITMQEAGHWMHADWHQMRREWLLEQLILR